MKLKKEYLILLLIIVALSAYLMMRTQNQTHYTLPQIAQTDSKKINRMVITNKGKSFELDKKDDQWTVGPKAYAADAVKVRNMVKAATDLTLSDLISETGNYERYDLTADQKIDVQAFAGGTMVRNFAVGKASPTYQHTFVRLADDPNVYTAKGQLSHTFTHTISDLRDLTVLSFEKDAISDLAIQKGKQSLTLAKKEIPPKDSKQGAAAAKTAEKTENKETGGQPQFQWQAPDGKSFEQPTVLRLLNQFSVFKCDTYLADDAAKALEEKSPLWTLTFKAGEKSYRLSVFDKANSEATEFSALSSAEPYAFTLNKSKVESIEKLIDKLLSP
jgi:Domain of unknown function (DUF4340)